MCAVAAEEPEQPTEDDADPEVPEAAEDEDTDDGKKAAVPQPNGSDTAGAPQDEIVADDIAESSDLIDNEAIAASSGGKDGKDGAQHGGGAGPTTATGNTASAQATSKGKGGGPSTATGRRTRKNQQE